MIPKILFASLSGPYVAFQTTVQHSIPFKPLARAAALWLCLAVASAYGDNSKISPDLQALLTNPSSKVNVIVQYNSSNSNPGLLGGLLGAVTGLLSGVLNTVFSLISAGTAVLHPADIVNLSNQSNVTYISLDRSLASTLDYSAARGQRPLRLEPWPRRHGRRDCASSTVGIDSHPDLNNISGTKSRVVYRQNFVGGVQYDDYGHGTHVAGIAAGNGYSSQGSGALRIFKGIAPNANVLDLRVLDANGMSSDSVVIAALEKAVALKSKYNVRVINLSLGRPIYESCTRDPLCQAVEAAWANGIVVVAAAGNLGRNGYGTVLSPGNSPHAITVGCMKTMFTDTRSDDLIASYSSKGPTAIDLTAKPDLVAPGNLVDSSASRPA